MMIGEKETKDNFKYLSSHGVRSVASVFISDEARLKDLVNKIPENILTGFHLYDILAKTTNRIKVSSMIFDALLFNKRFPKTLEVVKKPVGVSDLEDEK